MCLCTVIQQQWVPGLFIDILTENGVRNQEMWKPMTWKKQNVLCHYSIVNENQVRNKIKKERGKKGCQGKRSKRNKTLFCYHR